MTHTPGPWTLIETPPKGRTRPWPLFSIDAHDANGPIHILTEEALEPADACLIAAAPAMLEALKKLVKDLHETDEWKRTEAAGAEAAIALAQGQTLAPV